MPNEKLNSYKSYLSNNKNTLDADKLGASKDKGFGEFSANGKLPNSYFKAKEAPEVNALDVARDQVRAGTIGAESEAEIRRIGRENIDKL
jgi:hypothetical protein